MTNPTQSPPAPRRAPSVRIAFRTLGRTLRHGYENLGTLAITGLFWYIGAILIVPLGVITAALHRVTQPMTEERSSSWRSFFDHLRTDLRWSSLLMVILIGGFFLLQQNISFYSGAAALPLRLVGAVFIGLLLVWIGVSLCMFPMALRQEEQHVRRTLRNTLLMTMTNLPGLLLSAVLLVVLCGILLVLPPLFLLIPGVAALWGQENVRLLLVASGYLPEDPIADRPRKAKK